MKDLFGACVFLLIFSWVVFFNPEMGGYFLEHANFVSANSLVTPAHIAPVWYFTPFYAMLRAVPDKLMGVVVMGAAIAVLFLLPWLDRAPVRSIRYRGMISKIALGIFVVSFLVLGYLGAVTVTPERKLLAQLCTILYFAYFLLMPVYTTFDKCKPVPERITKC